MKNLFVDDVSVIPQHTVFIYRSTRAKEICSSPPPNMSCLLMDMTYGYAELEVMVKMHGIHPAHGFLFSATQSPNILLAKYEQHW